MRIVVTCPADKMELYMEYVAEQFAQGYICGHVDNETFWGSESGYEGDDES